jgi:MSHA biogenesis protein MshL
MKNDLQTSFQRVLTITVAVWLSGCANVADYQKEVEQRIGQRKPATEQIKTVRTVERSTPRGRVVDDVDARDAVNINVRNANFYEILRQLSNRRGYGITAVQSVDVQRQITLDLRGQTIEQAMRQIAWQAGYAVVINKAERSVTVSDQATMVFAVPSEDLKRTVRTDYKFGGSAIGASGGSSAGSSGSMPGASASGATSINPISATFTVTGEYGNNPAGFKSFLESLAGKNTQIEIFAESGLVSVRGNGQALKRVNDFLSKYDYNARRQIEINARLVDVALTDSFKYGIQWDKVMNADATSKVGINTLGTVGTDTTSSLSFTTASITSVVKALEQFTSVDVVSTPKLIVSNNSSGVFFKGTQVPYLPQVTTSTVPSGTGTTTQQSGSGAYAQDGVNLAVHASILDDENAVITLVPSTVTLGTLHKFLNDQVQMYDQAVQNGGQRINITSGQTVVISGTKASTNNSSRLGVPGLVDIPGFGALFAGNTKDVASRESVLIINARILNPTPKDIVFSESI